MIRAQTGLFVWISLIAIASITFTGNRQSRGQNPLSGRDRPPAKAQDTLPPEHCKKIGDTWTNSVGMRLIYIPAGEFDMGSAKTEAERDGDETLHHVKITKPFLMAMTTVTQAQWTAIMGTTLAQQRDKANTMGKVSVEGDHLPMYYVSWDEAVEFCNKLSAKDGRKYRLPTEAQWEYACRAGTTTPFNFGPTINPSQANYLGREAYANGVTGVYREQPIAVGSFKSNGWGLYDMHGNMAQWCSDYMADYPPGNAVDPTGPPTALAHVVRGGGWYGYPSFCRSAARAGAQHDERLSRVGLRVCLDLSEPDAKQ